MAKGYWIARVDVRNPDGYNEYSAGIPAVLRKFGGSFVTRGGRLEVMEGDSRRRIVVLEFPSYEAALACYRSPEYAKLIPLRQANADADLIVIEGIEGAQP